MKKAIAATLAVAAVAGVGVVGLAGPAQAREGNGCTRTEFSRIPMHATITKIRQIVDERGYEAVTPESTGDGLWMHGWIFGSNRESQCAVITLSEYKWDTPVYQFSVDKVFYGFSR